MTEINEQTDKLTNIAVVNRNRMHSRYCTVEADYR